jgi:hypothetical protein
MVVLLYIERDKTQKRDGIIQQIERCFIKERRWRLARLRGVD